MTSDWITEWIEMWLWLFLLKKSNTIRILKQVEKFGIFLKDKTEMKFFTNEVSEQKREFLGILLRTLDMSFLGNILTEMEQ